MVSNSGYTCPRGQVLTPCGAQRLRDAGGWAGGHSPGGVHRHPTHRGPAYWRFCRTDLAKLLIFYKDLNQRSIMESPANTVSSPSAPVPGCPAAGS